MNSNRNGSPNRVRELREAKRLTQVELAGRAGITQEHLSQIERGDVKCPSLEIARSIAAGLQEHVDAVFPRPPQISIRGEAASRRVWFDGKELTPEKSLGVVNHSPGGFAWGYSGSGPSQLALAILLELTDKATALQLYQDFKGEVLARLDVDSDFEITLSDRWWTRIAGAAEARTR